MKLHVGENRELVIEEAFNGVLFRTEEGHELGVSMRDDGFDLTLIPAAERGQERRTTRVLYVRGGDKVTEPWRGEP